MFNIDDFVSDTMFMLKKHFQNDDTVQKLEASIRNRHIRDGYFSMDGMYDDFCDILQSENLGRRYYNMVVGV